MQIFFPPGTFYLALGGPLHASFKGQMGDILFLKKTRKTLTTRTSVLQAPGRGPHRGVHVDRRAPQSSTALRANGNLGDAGPRCAALRRSPRVFTSLYAECRALRREIPRSPFRVGGAGGAGDRRGSRHSVALWWRAGGVSSQASGPLSLARASRPPPQCRARQNKAAGVMRQSPWKEKKCIEIVFNKKKKNNNCEELIFLRARELESNS